LGFKVDWENLPISKETLALQQYFKLTDEQMLAMSSTGTMLAAVDAEIQEKVKATLNKLGVAASFVGEFTKNKKRILMKNGEKTFFPHRVDDPYALLLGKI